MKKVKCPLEFKNPNCKICAYSKREPTHIPLTLDRVDCDYPYRRGAGLVEIKGTTYMQKQEDLSLLV